MNMTSLFVAWSGVLLAQGGANSVKVAVVNLPEVSERYAKTADLEAHFEGVRTKLNEQRDEMSAKVEKMARSLQEELKPGTEVYEKRRKEVAMQEAELQWFVEVEGKKVEQGLADALLKIYSDIQTVVSEVAKDRGFDIVLASDRVPDSAPSSPAQVRQHILLQKVLYWSPSVDISDEVIQRLNARYRK